MPRLAGNDPGYRWELSPETLEWVLIDKNTGEATQWRFDQSPVLSLDSVTTILKETLGKPAGAMSWWGYRVALNGVADSLQADPDAIIDAADASALEGLLKERGISPNMSLDSASSRGTNAHTVLEVLADGNPQYAEELAAEEVDTAGTQYGYGVIAWWDTMIAPHIANGEILEVVSERPVWSLRLGYAGTLDLAIHWRDWDWEVTDLKTHKPAAGFTKPGQGCAYISDVIQIGAYRRAWEELGLGKTTRQRVVIARENGKWLEDAREVEPGIFDHLLQVYRMKQTFERGGEQ